VGRSSKLDFDDRLKITREPSKFRFEAHKSVFVQIHVSISSSLRDSIPFANAVTVSIASSSCKSISTKPSSFHTTQTVFAVTLQPAR